MNEKEILDYAREEGYDSITKLGEWNGYIVYDPSFAGNETVYAGYPLVILVKDKEIRLSEEEECFEILDFFANKED